MNKRVFKQQDQRKRKGLYRFLAVGLVVTSLVGIGFADQIKYTFGTLLQMATEAALQRTVNQMEAKVLADKVVEAKKLAKENENSGGTRDENLKRDLIVKVDTLAASQNAAYQTLAANQSDLQRNVTVEAGMLDLIIARQQWDAAKESIAYYEKDVALAKKKQQLGQLTALQVLEKENALFEQQQQVYNLEQAAYQKALELERLVGEPLSGQIQVTHELKAKSLPKEIAGPALTTAVGRQLSVVKAQNTVNEKALALQLTDVYYDAEDKELKLAQYDLQVAEFELNNAKKTEEIALLSDYKQLKLLQSAHQLSVEYVGQAQAVLKDLQRKQQLGTVTQLEVMQGELQLRNKKVEASKALAEYLKAVMNFELKSAL